MCGCMCVCRVALTSEWLSDGVSKEEVLVGYITGLGGGKGVAFCEDQEVAFPYESKSFSGYVPHRYDWVKVCR